LDYQDVITYKPDAVKIFDEEDWDLMEDSRYKPIILALRKGPMTVRDLEEEYNKIIEQKIEKMDLEKKERNTVSEKLKRKGKTLYKYLDILIKKGLIIEAGKRVKTGQTAAETLYGRTAKLFVLSRKIKTKKPIIMSKEAGEVVCSIISKEKNKTSMDINCFRKIFDKILESNHQATVDYFTKYSHELSEVSPKISFEELNEIAWILDIFHIIKSAARFEKEIESCFIGNID